VLPCVPAAPPRGWPARSPRCHSSPCAGFCSRARHNAHMLALLATFSLQELRHHPWRNATAVLAVMLGVALAFSVHLINASALSEFSSAARSAGGEPDLELRAVPGGFDESVYARAAAHPGVALASPVLE